MHTYSALAETETHEIEKVLDGDMRVFETLVARYQDYVFSLVLKIVGRRELAEEVAQDVFVKAYHALKGFRRDSRFSTWLYRIAYTSAISTLRKENKHRYDSESDVESTLENSDTVDQTTDLVDHNDRKKYLQMALDQLNEKERAVISLFYLNELPLKEIAEIMGETDNNIKVRLFRARKRMSIVLNDILNDEVKSLL